MRSRTASRLAWSVCGLSLALLACALALAVLNGANVYAVSFPLGLTASAVVGGLVASRRPENPVAWFFLGGAACFAFVAFASGYATYGLLTVPGALPGAWAIAWPLSWLWVPGVMLLLCFVPLYFPDGRLVSPRWRWIVRFALVFCVGAAVHSALSPGEIQGSGIVNPPGIEVLRPVFDLFETLVFALYFPLLFASATSLVVRFRRSGNVERQQIKWLALAALVIPVWFLTNAPIQAAAPNLFAVMDALVVFALIPLAAGIAILRYCLYDIDVVINRALVYGTLSVTLALVYFGGIAVLQGLFRALTGQESSLAVVASTLLIAALFNPLRRRVQAFVDRRFYRNEYDAARTLHDFSTRLRDGPRPSRRRSRRCGAGCLAAGARLAVAARTGAHAMGAGGGPRRRDIGRWSTDRRRENMSATTTGMESPGPQGGPILGRAYGRSNGLTTTVESG